MAEGAAGSKKRTFACEYCAQEFPSLYKLLKHTRTHTFNCHTCHRSFCDRKKLSQHEMTHNRKPLTPDLCPKVSPSRADLAKHARLQITRDETCCKSFS